MTKIANEEGDPGCAGLNGARLLAAERLRSVSSVRIAEPFTGEARTSLDGTILALDSRKDKDLAVIRLTAGGREVQCKVDQISDDDMVRYYKKRCTIFGVGHYIGSNRLPEWVQVSKIELVETGGRWGSWKAAFPELKLDEWH